MARKTFLSGKGDFSALLNGSGERLVAHHDASSVTPRTVSKPDRLIGPKSASKVLLNGQPLSKCFLWDLQIDIKQICGKQIILVDKRQIKLASKHHHVSNLRSLNECVPRHQTVALTREFGFDIKLCYSVFF